METATEKKPKNIFVDGPVSPEMIARSIANHQVKTTIGAHDIFLGQVRADEVNGRTVAAIEYTAYPDMALDEMHRIREEAFARFSLTCMHVHHSLGTVQAGQLCLFVFVSAPHREAAFEACRFVTESIKLRLPVFGKEVFTDGDHQWKVNR